MGIKMWTRHKKTILPQCIVRSVEEWDKNVLPYFTFTLSTRIYVVGCLINVIFLLSFPFFPNFSYSLRILVYISSKILRFLINDNPYLVNFLRNKLQKYFLNCLFQSILFIRHTKVVGCLEIQTKIWFPPIPFLSYTYLHAHNDMGQPRSSEGFQF